MGHRYNIGHLTRQQQEIIRNRDRNDELLKEQSKKREKKETLKTSFVNVYQYKDGELVNTHINEVTAPNLLSEIKGEFSKFIIDDTLSNLKSKSYIMVDNTPVSNIAGFIEEIFFKVEIKNQLLEFIKKSK
ncbi:hypothetical protein ABXS71_06230 [Bacillus infantis]|uniref:hypothetical protein n=1 Tax=Bacillus infantis TaxID=324767 RepID=UPI00345078AF